MRGGLTGGRTGRADAEAAADADADASNAAANAANAKAANAANAKASNAANSATNDADDAAGAGAVPHDVFDSQGRRFHGPALEGTNILRLVDLAWFREECDDTLRARLGHHDRDAFDLVSKYVLALKARDIGLPAGRLVIDAAQARVKSGWGMSRGRIMWRPSTPTAGRTTCRRTRR